MIDNICVRSILKLQPGIIVLKTNRFLTDSLSLKITRWKLTKAKVRQVFQDILLMHLTSPWKVLLSFQQIRNILPLPIKEDTIASAAGSYPFSVTCSGYIPIEQVITFNAGTASRVSFDLSNAMKKVA